MTTWTTTWQGDTPLPHDLLVCVEVETAWNVLRSARGFGICNSLQADDSAEYSGSIGYERAALVTRAAAARDAGAAIGRIFDILVRELGPRVDLAPPTVQAFDAVRPDGHVVYTIAVRARAARPR
jgi:hypothetical protein